jgi:hypothetical protein
LRWDIWDRTYGTGQSGQVGLTGEPGQVRLEKTETAGLPGHDSGIRRAVDKVGWAEHMEQDSRDRKDGTGKDICIRQDI